MSHFCLVHIHALDQSGLEISIQKKYTVPHDLLKADQVHPMVWLKRLVATRDMSAIVHGCADSCDSQMYANITDLYGLPPF